MTATGRSWRMTLVVGGLTLLAACGSRAAPTDATSRSRSTSTPLACPAGTADCNNRADDGCEARPSEDFANCGACGVVCPAGTRALPVCLDGRCAQACRVGFAECDGDPATDCETETLRDPCHCNGCGRACAEGLFCVAGLCQGRQDPLVQTGPPAPAACP
jgi:hypothetical protein